MTPDNREPSDTDPTPDNDGKAGSPEDVGDNRDASRVPLPIELQNWRVMEVEGTVTPRGEDRTKFSHLNSGTAGVDLEDSDAGGAQAAGDFTDSIDDSHSDRQDDRVILSVPDREVIANPGTPATFTLSVLNNAERSVVLQIDVKGNVSPAWFPEMPMRVPLQPGERQSFVVMVAPSLPEAPAGMYAFSVVARQADRPERKSQVSCSLSILRKSGFQLGMLQPERVVTSWWTTIGRTVLPISNLGNHEMSYRVVGADADRECVFEFDAPYGMFSQVGQASFSLSPGARETVGITILPKRRPVVGILAQERPFRVAVEPTGVADQIGRQIADGLIVTKALIGPWQMAALALVVAAALAVTVLSSAAVLLALRPAQGPPAVVVPTAAPAPAFALVLRMDEPVPTYEAVTDGSALPGAALGAPLAGPVTEPQAVESGPPAELQNGLPVVQQDQVSAPGDAPARAVSSTSNPTPVTVAPVDPGNMTYAQMFQQVASRYDLNWRMLAAQGYVESGFDSTAVGKQGSMGIMQIHPDTWQEWAPHVDAVDPFDTYGNVLVAGLYLDYLRSTLSKEGHPQVEWMLAAYNWGPDKVLGVLGEGGAWTDLPAEVQQYAADVLRIAQSIPGN
ncbi:MAG: transglycosylase SLT domain-containing protein [Caldilineaceae bacterium]